MSNEQKSTEQTKQSTGERHSARPGLIVVELGNDTKNTNPYLSTKEMSYRGIRRSSNCDVGERLASENQAIPSHIPGFFVEVDIRNRRVSLYDPLNRPKYAKVREDLEKYLENPPGGILRRRFTPLKDEVVERCQNDDLVKWLKMLWVLVDSGEAQLREGEFPPEIEQYIDADRKHEWSLIRKEGVPLPQLV